MKKWMIGLMMAALLVPASVMAMDHGKMNMGHDDMKKMDHGKMDMDHDDMKKMGHEKMEHMDHDDMGKMDHDHMGHGQMDMGGGMVMLGADEEDGVKVMAHAKVYDEKARETMAKMGMGATHHLMVMFSDEKTGKAIAEGAVAVKIKGEHGKAGKAIKLMPMEMDMGAGFGADVELPGPGEYEIKIGTKLADGKKRTFELHYKNK